MPTTAAPSTIISQSYSNLIEGLKRIVQAGVTVLLQWVTWCFHWANGTPQRLIKHPGHHITLTILTIIALL